VAIVVQRFSGVTGGSESHARYYAGLLAEKFDVHVFTTTAKDIDTCENHFPAGTTAQDGFRVTRFPVSVKRTRYWHAMNELLIRQSAELNESPEHTIPAKFVNWPVALQEEWVRRQGPHSVELLQALATEGSQYRAIVYYSYLYSHAYFGSMLTHRSHNFMVPTLHDEPAAHLSCFRESASRIRSMLWNSDAERLLGKRLWGDVPGRVIGMGIDLARDDRPPIVKQTYILYCGRIDPNKGCDTLFEIFHRLSEVYPELNFVLTGQAYMKIPNLKNVQFLGHVSEADKTNLMRHALCLAMPSPNESLSVVTLEAMLAGTPALVNGENPVLAGHISESGGGWAYRNHEDFVEAIGLCIADSALRGRMGMQGQAYVRSRYTRESVGAALFSEIMSAD